METSEQIESPSASKNSPGSFLTLLMMMGTSLGFSGETAVQKDSGSVKEKAKKIEPAKNIYEMKRFKGSVKTDMKRRVYH